MSHFSAHKRTTYLPWIRALLPLCATAMLFACREPLIEPNPPPLNGDCGAPLPAPAGEGKVVWGAPELVPMALEHQPVRPHLVVANQSVYVAFEVQSRGPGDSVITPVGIYVMHRTGSTWSDPVNVSKNATLPSGPIIGVDRDGAAHLIWGEEHGGDSDYPLYSPTTMFYATNESGEWSTPDRIWFGTKRAALNLPRRPVLSPTGEMHLLFTPAWEDYRGIIHLRRSGGIWSPPNPVPGQGYPDLAFDHSGRMIVAFIAGDSSGANRVFFTSSDDDGATWSPPRRVLHSGATLAYDSRITVGGDGNLHLIWTRDIDNDIFADVLQHSYSLDGICWSSPFTIPTPPGNPGPAEVVADGAGGLHLVYHRSGGAFDPPFQAVYLYWDGSIWSEPEQLFGSDMIGQRIGLYRDHAGTLHLTLSGEINGVSGIHYATGRVAGRP